MKKISTKIIAVILGIMLVAGVAVAIPLSASAATLQTDSGQPQPGGDNTGAGGGDMQTQPDGAGGGDMGTPPDGTGGSTMGDPPDGGAEPPGGFGGGGAGGEGGMAGVMGDGAPSQAAIYIKDGAEDTASEYEAGKYSSLISVVDGVSVIDGLELESDDYTFNGLVANNSKVKLINANVYLKTGSTATSDMTGGTAVSVDNAGTLYISDSELKVDGSARYTTAAYNDAVLVVNNSKVISGGSNEYTTDISEPASNEALLISGNARSNFSIGATKTYYFNSECTAEGWAALSTDSATGNGLDLYAYNTKAVAENGGYSTYADTNCRVWIYGSDFSSAEIGCIISKNGQITAAGTKDTPSEVLAYNEGDTVDKYSSIIAGRNAVMVHAPDMMGQGVQAAECGTFSMTGGKLATSSSLVSTKDYSEYSDAVDAYVKHITGSVILIKSTSADISLDGVEMESADGILVHSVLNSDSMGNFINSGESSKVQPITVALTNMNITGDILHEDYQRVMNVNLAGTTLTGNISAYDVDNWNSTWKDYGEVNWVVDDSSYDSCGVNVKLDAGSVWNAVGISMIDSLTLAEGATINGVVTVDGQIVDITGTQTLEGEIVVSDAASIEDTELVETTEEAVVEEPTPAAEETSAGLSTGAIVAIIIVAVIIIVLVIIVAIRNKNAAKKDDNNDQQ